MQHIDPTTLVDSLDVEQPRAELDALERRQSAVRVLLRAAMARRRDEVREHRTKPGDGKAVRS
jgi:hypothetical protein